jgi:proteasome lid subunit RPN8/RPN11
MAPSASALVDAAPDWDSEVLRALYQLVFASTDREVAGVLVGSPPDPRGGGLPVVRAAIPATQSFVRGEASTFAYVTWAHVHDAMARYYPGLDTIGWYVSRPGGGTALTTADLANHRRWFDRPGQIVLVVDSLSHRAALYGQEGHELVPLTEGPVARRYTHPPRPRFPLAGIAVLAVAGIGTGAFSFLIAQALGG